MFIGRTDVEAETSTLLPPDAKNILAEQMRQINPWQCIRMLFLGNYENAVLGFWNWHTMLVVGSQTRTQWNQTFQGGVRKGLAAWWSKKFLHHNWIWQLASVQFSSVQSLSRVRLFVTP